MTPPSLKAGDTVGIISTARKISSGEIDHARSTLEGWGLKTIMGKTIGTQDFQFAGSDDLRRADLQQMIDDDEVRAVLFARGGYGTVRIIDDIDWRKFLRKPKWLCGFSDISVIHSHLTALYNVPSIHSLMAFNFATATSGSIASFRKLLFGEKITYHLQPNELNREGEARGILCGGNLSIMCSLLSSDSDIDTEGKILFLEEIDEHLYHVDRMIMALKRAGKLESLAGLVSGYFTDMKNKDEQNPFGKAAYEIVAGHVSEYNYPVCFGFPAGHEQDNRAMIFGSAWQLKVGSMVEFNML